MFLSTSDVAEPWVFPKGYENMDQENHPPWLRWVHLGKSPAPLCLSFSICKTGFQGRTVSDL